MILVFVGILVAFGGLGLVIANTVREESKNSVLSGFGAGLGILGAQLLPSGLSTLISNGIGILAGYALMFGVNWVLGAKQ